MLRVADQNLDKFELYTLKNVFAVPDDLQLASPQPIVTEEESQLDAETEALWAQLQRSSGRGFTSWLPSVSTSQSVTLLNADSRPRAG
jgi:hypothetical protein